MTETSPTAEMQSAVTDEPLPVAVIAVDEIEFAAMSQPVRLTLVEPPVEIAPEADGWSASTQAGRPLLTSAVAATVNETGVES